MISNLPLYDKLIIHKKNGEVITLKLDEIRSITYGNALTDALYPEEYAVDLGLSVKWAPMNLGAKDENDSGNVFSWGGIEPQESKMFKQLDENAYDKDCIEFNAEHRLICGTDRDAAKKHWGGAWRMPTGAEIEELITKCTWSVTSDLKTVIAKGPNGNSIIFKCDHHYFNYGDIYYGNVLSGELHERDTAIVLDIRRIRVNSSNTNEVLHLIGKTDRRKMMHIRAVLPKD